MYEGTDCSYDWEYRGETLMLTAKLKKKLRDFEMDIELLVNPGEVLVLLGENGSGKSTILNLLAGLLTPDEGTIVLNGKTLFCSEEKISYPPEERGIGYVFQNYALFPHMSVLENVAFGLKMRKISSVQIHLQIDGILKELGINHVKNEPVINLSGGQRQRVALARALIIQPHLLLLDEPLTALDRVSREKIRLELREQLVNSHQPAILVTHSIKDAMILGDRVIVIQEGSLIWTGKPEELEHQRAMSGFSPNHHSGNEYINFSSIAID